MATLRRSNRKYMTVNNKEYINKNNEKDLCIK